jgi:RNA polymerase sigma factor (sigma-70 family)
MSLSGEQGEPAPPSLGERILASLPGLTRFVRRRMGPELASRESAADIVQSTCRELLRSAPGYEDRGDASFQHWIRSAAEHKLANRGRHWRAARRANGDASLDGDTAVPEPVSPATQGPLQEALLREEAERLRRAFESLPVEYRRVIERFQIDGASQALIAQELGCTSEAARKLIARAMARLSSALEDRGAQSEAIERTGRAPEG